MCVGLGGIAPWMVCCTPLALLVLVPCLGPSVLCGCSIVLGPCLVGMLFWWLVWWGCVADCRSEGVVLCDWWIVGVFW